MSHTVSLNFTKIQEHCISLKNRHMSHVVFLNFSIESLSKNPSHVTYGVTKIQEHSMSLKNRHMSHMVLLNFTKIQEYCISL